MAIFNKKFGLACRQAGFTLVELLVVISIIATLTAILLPNFMGARERAADSQKKQDLMAMKNALRLFYNDTQGYPATGTNLGTTLAPYMPSIAGIGFTYTYTGVGDSFSLRIGTEATSASENYESQKRCGIGTTSAIYYYVCAN